LYYLRIDGRPSFVGEIEDWRKIFSLELFISRDRAEKTAVKERAELKEAGIEDVDLDVAAATGSDLLRLISATDVIELANRRLAISREDMFFDRLEEVATFETLAALIDKVERQRARLAAKNLKGFSKGVAAAREDFDANSGNVTRLIVAAN